MNEFKIAPYNFPRDIDTVLLSELETGEVFILAGYVYMVVAEPGPLPDPETVKVVLLSTGVIFDAIADQEVLRATLKANVKAI